jgi:flagellar hook-basal body protein
MSFYTSLTGLNAASSQLGVTSNNIANVGTSGFKRSRADFGDIFATSPLQRAASTIGQGVALKQVSQEFSQGNIQSSGNSLDLAITGDGFFPLRSPDGLQDIYTRNGAFFLNEQNNVVNSAGQRLMAAQVDSSGKADLSQLRVLTIPPKTIGQARETTKIQLGLNLPADAPVIREPFDRNNPATYSKSTALTVYDGGGNGYLATVYYVKTSSPSPLVPQAKWQTHVFVGESRVEPALMQATDPNGERLYVNKYGDLKPESEVQEELVSTKTPMFSLNQLTDLRTSVPAQIQTFGSLTDSLSGSGRMPTIPAGSLTISVDGSKDVVVNISEWESATEPGRSDLPENVAARLTTLLNQAMGSSSLVYADPPGSSNIVDDRRYGLQVRYDPASGKFAFSSGTTGDGSSIVVKNATPGLDQVLGLTQITSKSVSFQFTAEGAASATSITIPSFSAPTSSGLLVKINDFLNNLPGASTISATVSGSNLLFSASGGGTVLVPSEQQSNLAIQTESSLVTEKSSTATRGKPSEPAVLRGDIVTINTSSNISVNDLNNTFNVTVDGVRGTVRLENGNNYTIGQIVAQLQSKINDITDPETGRVIRGVKVAFDSARSQFVFTTGTTGDNASIRVTNPASEWGLRNAETVRGSTSSWFALKQFEEEIDGQLRPQFIDERGQQTSLRDGFNELPAWSPIFFDKGELSFDIRGRLASPATPMLFNTVFLEGGRGALNVNIDFTQSTQFATPFAVLSQSQDGAPEGDLLGLDIGVDGLVNASYSNGSQQSLGKIVLANFASPTGLRQLGDASYLATSVSGAAKIGEPGSAGFGSIRAGATERANVDLTQELVDLITAQRNFQANAKAIETSSTMTQAIINIRS